jgi:hypothetical protein
MPSSRSRPPAARPRLALLLCAAAAVLAACGGGLYIGIGDDDAPPDVSLVASVSSAAAGQVVRLSAAATDDWGVDYVAFYRIDDSGNAVLLGSDGSAPYQWDATMPATSATGVQFYARAVDGADQASQSETVVVTLLR